MFRTVRLAAGLLGAALLIDSCASALAQSADVQKPKIALDFVPPDATVAAVAYPRQLLNSPALDLLPREIVSAAVKSQLGIDPAEVDEVLAVAQPSPADPSTAIIVLCSSPINADKLSPAVFQGTTQTQLNGKPYHKANSPAEGGTFLLDDHTLIFGSDSMIQKVVANHAAPKEGAMTKILSHAGGPDLAAVALIEPMRPMINEILAHAPLPPPLADAGKLPGLLNYVALSLNVTTDRNVKLVVRANNEADAEKAEQIIAGLMDFAQQMSDSQTAPKLLGRDPLEKAAAQYQKRLAQQMLAQVKPLRKGPTLLSTIDFNQAAANPAANLVERPKIALEYVTPEAVAAIVAYPRHLLTSPQWSGLPIEVISEQAKQLLGFDPVELDEVLALGEMPSGGAIQYAVLLQFASPVAVERVLPMLRMRTVAGTLAGKPYQKGKGPTDPGIYQVDAQTLLVGTDDLLQRMLTNHTAPQEGPLSKMLGHAGGRDLVAVVMIQPLRALIDMGLSAVPIPPPLAGVKKLPALTNYVAVSADFSGTLSGRLTFCGNDEASAGEIEQTLAGLIAVGQQALIGQGSQMESNKDPTQQAAGSYLKRISGRLPDLLKPVRSNRMVSISGSGGGPFSVGLVAGLVLPAVQAAREAGRRAQSANNLKQITLAAFNYQATTQSLPPRASFDKQGKPLLSWRVHLLPFIDQKALYDQFHLDEPWDSPHNMGLVHLMPPIYSNPSSPNYMSGKASYLAVVGKGLMFEGEKGRRPAEITDGMSNTIMFLEVNPEREVVWTKPDDWEYNPAAPKAGIGAAHPAGCHVAFADGSVHLMPASIDPKTLEALLTIAGGEAVTPPF